MGRGSSGASKGGGGGGAKLTAGGTPSGVTVDQFRQMSEAQQLQTISQILDDQSIVVPSYLDRSSTSKVMYALGMNQKTEVVDDSKFDALPGTDLYRTVYESTGVMPPPTSKDITDQIRNGEYTQLSGSGGSAHGRAIYFANGFYASAIYGHAPYKANPTIMRCKLKQNAKIASESALRDGYAKSGYSARFLGSGRYSGKDGLALYAISKGYDGWFSAGSGYTMILNRGSLVSSNKDKSIFAPKARRNSRDRIAGGWSGARDV